MDVDGPARREGEESPDDGEEAPVTLTAAEPPTSGAEQPPSSEPPSSGAASPEDGGGAEVEEEMHRRPRERRAPARERDESNLYVGYIPTGMSGEDVTALFESSLGVKGAVQETSLIFDRVTREPKGYGFVKLWDHRLAAEAVRRLHGFSIDGKRLAVRVARDPPARASRGGGGGGGSREGAAAVPPGVPSVQGGAPPFGAGPPPPAHAPPMWVNPYQYPPYWGAPEGWYPPHAYHPAYQHSAYPQHVYAEGGGGVMASHHLGSFPEGAAALVAASAQLPAAAVGYRPGPA